MIGAGPWFFPKLAKYYNSSGLTSVFVTMDVDWAPDSVVRHALDWFVQHQIKVTVFATHESQVLREFQDSGFVEIGLHPNLSRDRNYKERVQKLRQCYPRAIGARGHRNVCGRDLWDLYPEAGLKYDVSKLLWRGSHAECVPMYNGVIEVPYGWEDGVHLELNLPLSEDELGLKSPGVKILNIHPTLFYLDSSDIQPLYAFVRKHADLTTVSMDEFSKVKKPGAGVATLFRNAVLRLKEAGVEFFNLRDMMIPVFDSWQEMKNELSKR